MFITIGWIREEIKQVCHAFKLTAIFWVSFLRYYRVASEVNQQECGYSIHCHGNMIPLPATAGRLGLCKNFKRKLKAGQTFYVFKR